MNPKSHPQTLVSLSIIRTHPETDLSSAISSLALFTVQRRSRLDVAFAVNGGVKVGHWAAQNQAG